jgi:hypothetical protein
MPKVRDILTHVSVETAIRQRICHRKRNEHSIEKGESCLVIKDASTGGKKNYCVECAPEILTLAKARLDNLEADLDLA